MTKSTHAVLFVCPTLFSICMPLAVAQGDFGLPQIITSTADGAAWTDVADADGDGNVDVFVASENDGRVAWFRNANGDGGFSGPHLIADGFASAQVVMASDLDGDGDADVLAVSATTGVLAWYRNLDGLGSYGAQHVVTSAAIGAHTAFAADLDGDADADLLTVSVPEQAILVFKNSSGGGDFFAAPSIVPTTGAPWSVLAADLDGDGDLDIVSASKVDDTVAWFENLDGMGTFSAGLIITNSADGALDLDAADLDGDGDLDLLSASENDNKIAWYENLDGAGAFGPQVVITNQVVRARSVVASDLDRDGDFDVCSASALDDKIAWYENVDGFGTFGPQRVLSVAVDGARGLSAADIDGDGDTDLVAAAGLGDQAVWLENLLSPVDCNMNGLSDAVDLALGTSVDCNGNGVPDECDVVSGASADQDGNGVPDECIPPPLASDLSEVSVSNGGQQSLTLNAPPELGLQIYFVIGSASGTSPGITASGATLPLNVPDPYFQFTVTSPNQLPFVNTLSFLSPAGTGAAMIVLPAGPPGWVGLTLNHAYVVFGDDQAVEFVSNAVALELVP